MSNIANNKVMIIGAGGVGNVVTHKCAQQAETFAEIILASRTEEKCKAIAESVKKNTGVTIRTAQVDADNVPELTTLLNNEKPFLVINVALIARTILIKQLRRVRTAQSKETQTLHYC